MNLTNRPKNRTTRDASFVRISCTNCHIMLSNPFRVDEPNIELPQDSNKNRKNEIIVVNDHLPKRRSNLYSRPPRINFELGPFYSGKRTRQYRARSFLAMLVALMIGRNSDPNVRTWQTGPSHPCIRVAHTKLCIIVV